MKDNYRTIVKLSLLRVLCNATGIYRKTVSKTKRQRYDAALEKIILKLTKKIDEGHITNIEIRNEIRKLSKRSGCSVGAAQKGINVYLKFYSIVSNKDDSILKELDCPIDSLVIKKNKFNRISLRRMKDLKKYIKLQDTLLNNPKLTNPRKYNMRILADEAYDRRP